MTRTRAASSGAVALGAVVAFVVAVNLVRQVRPALLLDSEGSWVLARLLLGLLVVGATAAAGTVAAALFFWWGRSPLSDAPLEPLPLPRALLLALALAAIVLGGFARLAFLASVPETLWIDEVSEIRAALELTGRWRDFGDSIRTVPFGEVPTGSVGVLYLEFFRLVLLLFRTSVFSLRLPSTLAGIASLVTAGLLARRLLPRGGGPLAILILAGLSWHLTLSRVGWNAMAIAPVIDLAALSLLRARARNTPVLSLCSGALVGVGTHVYLSAWVAAAALLAVALWPLNPLRSPCAPRRLLIAALFAAGLVLAAAPLFLFRAGRSSSYFARTRHVNVLNEIRYWRSPMPVFEAAADGIGGPWLVSAKRPWQENVRLGWILGFFLAIAFVRALRRPHDEFSALLLAHAAAALAATVLAGKSVPNGFRFGYLSNLTAVATAGGALWVLTLAPRAARPAAALALVGIVCWGGVIGTRDMFRELGGRPGSDPSGQETLIGRAALRWEPYGAVEIDPRLIHFKSMVDAIRRYRLDPAGRPDLPGDVRARWSRARSFRIVPSGAFARPGERIVEIVSGRGGQGPVVLGMLRSPS